ncbi:SpoIIE family protein phosphatase [Streptomyces sp. NPDC127084]|uniref:SpoIIE family protein phosphatase n=1 Tax=Streptomyces sp. NPDC127084 TaxID=3347133 RepID=UPI00365C7911
MAAENGDFRGPLDITRAATLVLDSRETVIGWSPAAQELLGYRPEEVMGRPLETFLTRASEASAFSGAHAAEASAGPTPPPTPWLDEGDVCVAVHRDGHRLVLVIAACPLTGAVGAGKVLVVAEHERLRLWKSRLALLHGLATQSPIGLAIHDTDLHLTWCNAAYEGEIGLPFAAFRGMRGSDLYPEGRFISPGYPELLDDVLGHVLKTGEALLDLHFRGEQPSDPGVEHLWSCSYYRLQDPDGYVFGVCEDAFDISERYEAQRQLNLLVEASRRVGTTLDVVATTEELAEVAVPRFADRVDIDVAAAVLEGEVPGSLGPDSVLIRTAGRRVETGDGGDGGGIGGTESAVVPHVGPARPVTYARASPQHRSLASGGLVLDEDTLVVPLRIGGSPLGIVSFVRGAGPGLFDRHAVALADELVGRAAVSIDNARRFTRERAAALALQRQLLPRHLPQNSAVDLAYRYLPTDDVTGVGGDWFDVIPLSGTRVGLVVGDVVGHGVHAAATMGRLRTTVRALAPLDMPPDELLTRLDDLVVQAAEDRPGPALEGTEDTAPTAHARFAGSAEVDATPTGSIGFTDSEDVATGATCLYVVYDPASRHCTMARAGHPPPAVVHPDGEVTILDLPVGPPLGLGGLPFDCYDVELPVGSLMALFTDGLVESRDRDVDEGLATLKHALTDSSGSLDDICDRVLAALLPDGTTSDDSALLLVRTRELDHSRVAAWDLPAEPAAVGQARESAAERLRAWGIDELVFSTELIVSELVTNAVRHAAGPLHLRLIHDRVLVCEIADAAHTSPHLRHSAADDEGGRGLFIVAQLVQRWGTRYGPAGKTIWTEQALP